MENYFITSDLGCSAALICAGFELVRLDKTNPKKVQFIFQRESEIESAADEYWTDKLDVKARSFFDSIKALKNKIYSD